MTTRPPLKWKAFLVFLGPMMASNILQGLSVAFNAMLAMQTAYYRLVWQHQPVRRL